MRYSPDRQQLASGSHDGSIRLWSQPLHATDVPMSLSSQVLAGHTNWVWGLAFSATDATSHLTSWISDLVKTQVNFSM